MKEKFDKMVWDEDVDLTVTSLMDIHKKLGLPLNCPASDLVTKFMEAHGDKEKVKIFFDEFPVTKRDLNAVQEKSKDGDLIKMLRAIDEKSCQAFISLKTTCLLDTVFAPGSSKATREVGLNICKQDLKDYIEANSNCKVKVLNLRLRNTSNIGQAVIANMDDYALKHEGKFPVACVLEPGNSNTTVPGERPHCVVGCLGGYKPSMENISMSHIAILCGDNIRPREVWKTIDYLNIKPSLYDGGVEYYSYATANHYPTNPVDVEHSSIQQRADLVQ